MHKVSITDLRRLVERADILLQREYKALVSHWNPDLQGFHTSSETRKTKKVNVTTTCFGVFALLRNAELVDQFFAEPDKKAPPTALDGVTKTLVTTPWSSEDLGSNNIYTAPIAISTLYQLLEDRFCGESVRKVLSAVSGMKQIREGLEAIIHTVKERKGALFPPYEPNAYLTWWCIEALWREAVHGDIDKDLAARCRDILDGLGSWGEGELFRQLGYHTSHDMTLFDPVQLGYALRIYTGYCGLTGRRINRKILEKGVDVVFEHQATDGLWPKSRPIFHFAKLGSVYPFTFEMLDVLIPSKPESGLFEPYIDKLEKSLRWAEDNYIKGEREKGWRSSHLPYGDDPHAWSTAAVLLTVHKIRTVLMAQINEDLLDDFRAQKYDEADEELLSPARFYDSEIPPGSGQSLKAVLKKHLIDAHKPGGSEADRRYSAVFYGPPGTAKTTTATAVARALGWPFIYLQTSDFAAEGVNQIIGKARNIFDRLALLEHAVILFDEVEEFVRERKDEEETSSRMLTASMLSLIQELRSKKGAIFIVATNFLDKFDSAITRLGGRFDMMVLISPPSRAEKLRLFMERLTKLIGKDAKKFAREIEKYVADRFEETFAFFAFTEWKHLADAFASDIAAKKAIDEKALDEIAKKKFATIAMSDDVLRTTYQKSSDYIRI